MSRPVYQALDVPFALHADGELGEVLDDALIDLRAAAGTRATKLLRVRWRRGAWEVGWKGRQAHAYDDVSIALYATMNAISDEAASRAAVTDVVLHATALDIGGVGVGCVGATGSGKSTLAAAAVMRGLGYLSDELCPVDEQFWARPFHRPVGLRAEGADVLGVSVTAGPFAETYPLRVGNRGVLSRGAALGLIVFLERCASPARLEELPPATALFRLAILTIGAASRETTTFRRLEQLVRHVPTRVLHYAETHEALELLERSGAGLDVLT